MLFVCVSGCPDPEFNNDTLTDPSPPVYNFRSVVNVTCPPGFVFSHEEFHTQGVPRDWVTMECLAGGSWDVHNTPNCAREYRDAHIHMGCQVWLQSGSDWFQIG